MSILLVAALFVTFLFALLADASTLKSDDIITNHDKVNDAPTRKHNNLNVLGFLTPWNSRGKDVTLKEAERSRLDIAAPVTFQVTPDGINGGHDYDQTFYDSVMKHGARVYPRFIFEVSAWPSEAVQKLETQSEAIASRIIAKCKEHKFQGVVLELWQTFIVNGALSPMRADATFGTLRRFGIRLRDADLHTVLVLPPYARPVQEHGVYPESMRELSMGYSQFITMTYDFTNPGATKPGPVAPAPWVRAVAKFLATECGLEDKVLLGLNFYGVDFAPRGVHRGGEDRHIVGHEVIALLEKHRPEWVWVDEAQEHAFVYKDDDKRRIVFYPTRQSIAKRLSIAEETGCGGVAIWDLGQGLDHFFEEF